MIAYDLQCSQSHVFEGWFEDRKAYLDQKKKKLIACPVCNDTAVSRLPSTFAIKTSQAVKPRGPVKAKVDLEKLGKEVVDFVQKNFDDVGCDFAKEALKIHYGVSEPRNIRGSSTEAEEKVLRDEGIEYLKIPLPASPDSD